MLADVLLPTPKLLHCPHIHALADRPPLTRRTPRLYQRAYRRRNTQHSRSVLQRPPIPGLTIQCSTCGDARQQA